MRECSRAFHLITVNLELITSSINRVTREGGFPTWRSALFCFRLQYVMTSSWDGLGTVYCLNSRTPENAVWNVDNSLIIYTIPLFLNNDTSSGDNMSGKPSC